MCTWVSPKKGCRSGSKPSQASRSSVTEKGRSTLPAGLGMALGAATEAAPQGSLTIVYEDRTLQQFKEGAERSFLLAKLKDHDWNVAATSKAIKTPRSNLYKKLEAYGISREQDG